MERRIKRLPSQVRMASRGWRPGELYKGEAGPRCQALTSQGTPCPNPMHYVNGYCAEHGGGPVMGTLRKRKRAKERQRIGCNTDD